MLNTDLPEGTWQRDAFPGALLHLTATDPMLSTFVQLVGITPKQAVMLLRRSDEAFAGLSEEAHQSELVTSLQQRALIMALREFYQAVGGEAIVRQHAPEVAAEQDGPAPARRSPGRPTGTGTQQPLLTGTIDGDVLAGTEGPITAALNREDIVTALRADMHRFAERLAASTDFFDDLQLGDTRVRMWTPLELATLIGVTPQTLLNWRTRGIGPGFIRIGARSDMIRYPVFRVVEWLTGA